MNLRTVLISLNFHSSSHIFMKLNFTFEKLSKHLLKDRYLEFGTSSKFLKGF
ncbi:hypothetical protein LEP1GSC197_0181 [Leptospira interrogans serovar Pomona str. CSL4002]|nr:hypothetical protein LEP1GSC197_0181 [Leptospira interrogans serovar Pomona str. CSL4002]